MKTIKTMSKNKERIKDKKKQKTGFDKEKIKDSDKVGIPQRHSLLMPLKVFSNIEALCTGLKFCKKLCDLPIDSHYVYYAYHITS